VVPGNCSRWWRRKGRAAPQPLVTVRAEPSLVSRHNAEYGLLVRRKGMRSALVAVVAATLSVQVALATPAHLTARLRAAGCCATHCSHAMARGCNCCHIAQGADDLRALPPASSPGHSAVALVMTPVPIIAPTGVLASLHASEPARNGPPLFLALRSLRR